MGRNSAAGLSSMTSLSEGCVSGSREAKTYPTSYPPQPPPSVRWQDGRDEGRRVQGIEGTLLVALHSLWSPHAEQIECTSFVPMVVVLATRLHCERRRGAKIVSEDQPSQRCLHSPLLSIVFCCESWFLVHFEAGGSRVPPGLEPYPAHGYGQARREACGNGWRSCTAGRPKRLERPGIGACWAFPGLLEVPRRPPPGMASLDSTSNHSMTPRQSPIAAIPVTLGRLGAAIRSAGAGVAACRCSRRVRRARSAGDGARPCRCKRGTSEARGRSRLLVLALRSCACALAGGAPGAGRPGRRPAAPAAWPGAAATASSEPAVLRAAGGHSA